MRYVKYLFFVFGLLILFGCNKKPTYKISFETNGGDEIDVMKFEEGNIELPVAIKEGYVFGGWYIDATLTILFDNSNELNQEFTLYAKWNEFDDLTKAINAVNHADETKLQTDINVAYSLITKLDDHEHKKLELLLRLYTIELGNAYKLAYTTKTNTDYQSLLTIYDEIKLKIDEKFSVIIAFLTQIEAASNLVNQADSIKSQVSVDMARSAVNNLPDCVDKPILTNLLDEIQNIINQRNVASYAVQQARLTKTENAVEYAQSLITELDEDDFKITIQDELDNVIAFINQDVNMNLLLEDVLEEPTLEKINLIKDSLVSFPESDEKIYYRSRISIIEAEFYVNTAETTKIVDDYNLAEELVNLLEESSEKNHLAIRLNILKEQIEYDLRIYQATKAVDDAKISRSLIDVNSAQELIDLLPAGEVRHRLQIELNQLRNQID